MTEEFGKAYWEDHYRGHDAPQTGHDAAHTGHDAAHTGHDAAHTGHDATHGGHGADPSPHLLAEAGNLPPGTALDAGCGEGANAIWLAARGWQVTAVDIAATALRHARARAAVTAAAGRIDWVEADLTSWTPEAKHFDLVCAHYVHPAGPRGALLGKLAEWVVPGGTLLIVDHADGAPLTVAAEELAAALDPGQWDVAVAEARIRTAAGPHGHAVTLHDAVLRARKRP
jgi:SAM-dependent methyltransferase